MSRIYYTDLPDETYPIVASRTNGLLNGEESIEKIVVGSIEGKNLFDKNKATLGYAVVNTTGEITASNLGAVSDYIDISNANSIILSGSSINFQSGGAFYNSSKTYISGFTVAQIKAGVEVPSNAKYVRVNTLLADISTTQIEKGSSATEYDEYMKYGYNSEESMGNIVVDDILPTNLIPFEAVTTTSNGVTFTANSDKSVTINGTATAQTDFTIGNVSLKAGQQYYLSGAKGGSANTWFLNIQGVGNDSGNGFIYTPAQDETKRIFIRVKNGVTVNNAKCTPKLNKGLSSNPFDNSESEVYSTNEIKIGRWVDGKPLYRKVIIGTCASAINTTLTLGNISNLKDVAEINANWKANDNYRYFMSNPSESPVVYINASGDVNENHKGTYFNSVSIIVTIKYTKTTD